MWNLLGNDYRHYITAHKKAEITWNNEEIGSREKSQSHPLTNHQQGDKILSVEYNSQWRQTSAGFRAEIYLEPNSTYQLEIKAKLIAGDMAFIYVESGSERLIPRFKVYQNTQPYRLKHNFTTPSSSTKNIPVYLGILFFYPEQNYLLEVSQFILRRLSKLTEDNLILHQAAYDPSILPSEDMNRSAAPTISSKLPSQLHKSTTTNNNNSRVVNSFPLIDLSELSITPSIPSKSASNSQSHQHQQNQGMMMDLMSDWTSPKISYSNESNFSGSSNATSYQSNNYSYQYQSNNYQDTRQPEHNADLVKILRLPGEVEEKEEILSPDTLPMEVSKADIDRLAARMRELGMTISISLTTIPTRLGKIDKVIDSLCAQSIPIKTVYLVIPTKHKRSDQPYFLGKKWHFGLNPKVKIVRTADVGPMTKLVQILDQLGSKDILLTADDDHIYPRHWAYFLSYLSVTNPGYKAIWGFKGHVKGKDQHSSKTEYPINVDWLLGSLGVAYPIKYIKNPSQMLKQVNFTPEAWFLDDILVGNHMALNKVNRVIVPRVADNIQNLVYPTPTAWSNSRDSLHRMNPSQATRQTAVIDALKRRNQFHFNYLGYIPKSFNNLDVEVAPTSIESSKSVAASSKPLKSVTLSKSKLKLAKSVSKSKQQQSKNSVKTQKEAPPATKLRESDRSDIKTRMPIMEEVPDDEDPHSSLDVRRVPNGKLIRTKFSKFDPTMLGGKKVRYISYQTCYMHIDFVLLYIRAISNMARRVTLEMPNLAKSISLPNEYGRWFGEDPSNFDVIIIDLPYCLESGIQVKVDVPVYYIYRYPEIGDANCIFRPTSSSSTQISNQNLVINTYYHSSHLRGQFYVWRVLPDIEVKSVTATWAKDVVHYGLVVSDGYFLENLGNLLEIWQSCNKDPIKSSKMRLHIGCVPPLNNKLQEIINKMEIKNINMYTASDIFGAMIYKCDYYLSVGYHVDLYAIWAMNRARKLIALKYGEMRDLTPTQLTKAIPYHLGTVQICPDLLQDHSKCEPSKCLIYGSTMAENVPIIDEGGLIEIFDSILLTK